MPTSRTRPLVRMMLATAFVCLVPAMASANWLGGVTFDHDSPGHLPHYLDIMVSVDYKITEPDGAKIYVMPMTDGAPIPQAQVSASAFIPVGEGQATRMFRIASGSVVVDQVRVRMTNFDGTAILLDFFVDSDFHFGDYSIYNIQYGKPEDSTMFRGQDLNIGFQVVSPGPESVRVNAQPYFDGNPVPGAELNEGFPIPPRGSSQQNFDFPDTDADIDQIRFTMTTLDGSTTLLEFDRNIRYFWRELGLTNLDFSSTSPSSLHNSQNVLVGFNYFNPTGSDVVIEVRPYLNGSPAPEGEYETGTIVPDGATATSRYFGSTGNTEVDQLRLVGTDVGGGTTYLDIFVPVSYDFAPHAVPGLATEPGPVAVLDFNEDLVCSFSYQTDNPGGVKFQAVPYSGGIPNPFFQTGTPSLYPSGTGTGTAAFRLVEGASVLEVDEVRIRILNEDLSQALNEVPLEGQYSWRGIGWASAVPLPQAGAGSLGQNHPNPFNPTTSIPLQLDASGLVRLTVYDLRGRLVKTLVDRTMEAGAYAIGFDGRGLPSGAYHYRLETGGVTVTRKMTLLK
jgi:hypothetical protein